MDEIGEIRNRYSRRKESGDDFERSSILPPHRTMAMQEKERHCLTFLRRYSLSQIASMRALEIGCGYGANLQQLIRWGFSPENLVGSELLEDRTEIARKVLPSSVTLFTGDSSVLDQPPASFDLVLISTVFSSILDDQFQSRLARVSWDFVRPGGAILWYDIIYNNPGNSDVRAVGRGRIRQLFPEAICTFRSATLAPPIARRVSKFSTRLYSLFNCLPLLRTHVIAWLAKPKIERLATGEGDSR